MSSADYEIYWNAIPMPVFVVNLIGNIVSCNHSAETFMEISSSRLIASNICDFVEEDEKVAKLIASQNPVILYDVSLLWRNRILPICNVHMSPLSKNEVMVTLYPRSQSEKIDRSLSHKSAARSVTGMAEMLVHEIRNPLAGIKGAAELLEMSCKEEDKELPGLIYDEVERIGNLVNRVEQFGDLRSLQLTNINIHDVLDRAKRTAQAGFASHVNFTEDYDPSLPDVAGDQDMLLQVFQNLLKNAAEAVPANSGRVTIKTAYNAGVKLQTADGKVENLPIEITIIDNGKGIPENIIQDIFDPFVSSKKAGTGLGLALVSKLIVDLSGMIECESEPGRTQFKILLPIWREKG